MIDNARRFRDGDDAAGFRIRPGFHPIAPVMMSGPRAEGGGDARLAQEVAAAMLAEGIYVVGFSYPVVPKGQARIRVQLSAAHTPAMVDRAIDAFIRVGKRFGSISKDPGMTKPVVLVTGANGEIGRSLLADASRHGAATTS